MDELNMRTRIFLLLLSLSFSSAAQYPTSFNNAKSKAEKEVYFDQNTTFYCQCDFVFDDTVDIDGDGDMKETLIMPEKCGYKPRIAISNSGRPNARTSRIEWEHVMPASLIGGKLDEWLNPHKYPECQKKNGDFLSGRECALKTNESFKKAHNDLNNLVPAVGELNGDRSNFQFANISGEDRAYGKCDFEVDFESDTAEPADTVKGNVARVYFHMMQIHNVKLDPDTLGMMLVWDKLDPVDEFECVRNERIIASQGLGNQFVSNECQSR